MRARLDSFSEASCLLLLGAAWAACVALSLALCGAGFLHPESYSFLPHYLSGRPLLELIYDNRVTDWGNYQARELAFVFDWLDAHFIAWCVGRGHPHFFSATHYVFLLGAGLALWRVATHYFGASRLAAFGLVLLLWTSPSAMLYTSFYRAAKVGLLLTTLLVTWAYFHARRGDAPGKGIPGLVFFALLAVLLPMFDKQGLLFLGALVLFLGWQVLARRTARDRQLFVAGVVVLICAWCYQRFVGPAITRHLLGYEVNRGYTTIPFAALLSQPGFLAQVALGGPLMAFDSFRFPLGDLPAGLALLGGWWMWRQFAATPPVHGFGRQWLFAGLVVFVTAVFGLMLMLFPLMLSNEHRRFFYGLPVAALWFVAVAWAVGANLRQRPAQRVWIEVVILALVVGNLCALPEHRFVLRQGKYKPFVANAVRVREALRPSSVAASGLTNAEAGALLAQAPYFQDDVPPSLREDRIYLALLPQVRGGP